MTHAQVGRVAKLGWRRRRTIGPDDCQIRKRVRADNTKLRGRAIGESGGAREVATHNVGVGQKKAIVGEHDSRARARLYATVAPAARHVESRDPERELCRDSGDDLGIRIERPTVLIRRRVLGDGVGHRRPFFVSGR